jgi:hypothetical protein
MIEQPVFTPLRQDIVELADQPVANYKDHLNKITQVQYELSNLLGVSLDNPQVRGTAEVLCGEWEGQ